jgi:ubiquinone/menaquinone biosynthesis C-methylase UbiE
MTDDPRLKMLDTYFSLMTMNGGSHVFRTSNKLGIFKALTDGSLSVEEISKSCELEIRPLSFLLDTLCELGVLISKGDSYALSPVMHFLNGDYANLSDNYWDHLETFLKTGEPYKKMDDVSESEEHYVKQVKALEWMMMPSAGYLAHVFESSAPINILDVGAGSGVWGLSLLEKNNESVLTVVDWPKITNIARLTARERGVEDRFQSIDGNFHEVDLPDSEYDVAILANVAHLETSDGNCALFNKIHKTLKHGGKLIVVDVFPTQQKGALAANMYALGLALRTQESIAYTQNEIEEFARSSGYDQINFIPLEITPHTMGVVVAIK